MLEQLNWSRCHWEHRLEDARGPCIDLASKHDPQKLSPTQTGLLFAVSLVMLVMFYKPGACPTTILQLTCRNAVVCILNLISLGAAAMQPLVPVVSFSSISYHCYSAPNTECGRSIVMSMSVCLSVRDHISRITRQNHTKFFLHVTYGRGSVRLWRRSDMLRISGLLMTSYLRIS